jgi:hypothetical protein
MATQHVQFRIGDQGGIMTPANHGSSTYNLVGRTTHDTFYNKTLLSSTNKIAANYLLCDSVIIEIDNKQPKKGDVLMMGNDKLVWSSLELTNHRDDHPDLFLIKNDGELTFDIIKQELKCINDSLTDIVLDINNVKSDLANSLNTNINIADSDKQEELIDKQMVQETIKLSDNIDDLFEDYKSSFLKDTIQKNQKDTIQKDINSERVNISGLATLVNGSITIKKDIPNGYYPLFTIIPGKPPLGQVWCSSLTANSFTISSTNAKAEMTIFYHFQTL